LDLFCSKICKIRHPNLVLSKKSCIFAAVYSITSIENEAFFGGSSQTTIEYAGTKAQWEKIEKGDN
jgi:hypothetical protein